MIASLLTTLFFASSIIFAARSAHCLGAHRANLSRMAVALVLLGLWAFTFGQGLRGASLGWYLFSGLIGFGIGDIALFMALLRIGPSLTVLMVQCLAAPIGALTEWLWLGTWLTRAQLLSSALILLGVAIAVAPKSGYHRDRRTLITGLAAGLVAALGQAWGAVTSRKAAEVAIAHGLPIDGGTAAFQRMIAGLLFTAIFYFMLRRIRAVPLPRPAPDWRNGTRWMLLNAFAGPALGVGCYQWALATTPSGLVLPIVAATPVVTLPLAWFINGEKPSRRALAGALVAVAGTIALLRAT